MPCKHAALAAIYAQQMAEMDEPWRLWQWKKSTIWHKCTEHPAWIEDCEYRQIPKTIRIGNYDVPEPMREKPAYGTYVWAINVFKKEGVYSVMWTDSDQDLYALHNGSLHLTRENCIIHAKALFSFSEIKE